MFICRVNINNYIYLSKHRIMCSPQRSPPPSCLQAGPPLPRAPPQPQGAATDWRAMWRVRRKYWHENIQIISKIYILIYKMYILFTIEAANIWYW